MPELTFETTHSTNGGLFFDTTVTWTDGSISGPTKAIPADCVTTTDSVDETALGIAEVYIEVDSTDLEAYDPPQIPNPIAKKLRKLEYLPEGTTKIIFFDHTGDSEISFRDVETMIEIQERFADITTVPLQSVLTNPISPNIDDGKDHLDFSPFPAYRKGLEVFLELVTSREERNPIMGTLPPIGYNRQMELLQMYERDFGVQLLAVDFQGFNPTTSKHFKPVKKLMINLAKRGRLSERLLYAINYKPYFPGRNSDPLPAEGLALVGSGFDVLGGTHVYRGGGFSENSDRERTIKLFDIAKFGFRSHPLSKLEATWPTAATISYDRFDSVGEKKQRELRKLVNAEGLYFALERLQNAIEHGNERQFLASKSGVDSTIEDTLHESVEAYTNAVGPGLSDY